MPRKDHFTRRAPGPPGTWSFLQLRSLGGRTHTVQLDDGTSVDLGANYIHGATPKQPVLQLAARCGESAKDAVGEVTFGEVVCGFWEELRGAVWMHNGQKISCARIACATLASEIIRG